MASPEARERFARKNEAEDLRRAFDFLDKKKDGVIDEDDLNQVFMSLGHKTKKGEIADMIWEVDEDCDNALNWKVRFATLLNISTCSLGKCTSSFGRLPSGLLLLKHGLLPHVQTFHSWAAHHTSACHW